MAVLKHSDKDIELDTVNKDTWRASQAGSELTAISSARKLAIFRNAGPDFGPEELSHFLSWDGDLLLTEGFKGSSHPKIEVHRQEQGSDLVSPIQQLLAVVTDEPLEVDVPQLSRDEIRKIADIIENRVLARQKEDDIDLLINGDYVPTSDSLRSLLTRTIIAILATLKGSKEIKNAHLSLRRKR